MVRQLITIAVPLLAPLALYLLYTWHLRRRGGETPEDPFSWREIPWIWLGAIGTGLVVLTLVATTIFWRSDLDAEYIPPRFEDGKRIPGHFER